MYVALAKVNVLNVRRVHLVSHAKQHNVGNIGIKNARTHRTESEHREFEWFGKKKSSNNEKKLNEILH